METTLSAPPPLPRRPFAIPPQEDHWIFKLVRIGALCGGLVMLAIVVMLVITIVGRKLFAWQVPGDVELVQMGAAFATAPFFAWCHLMRGEVKIDFLTQKLPPRAVAGLECLGSALVGLFGALLAWRTGLLALSTQQGGEISAILGWPAWIAQALMVPGFALLALAGGFTCYRVIKYGPPEVHTEEHGAPVTEAERAAQ